MAEKKTDEAFISLMRKRFARAVQAEADNRALAKIDRQMRSGDQWPEWARKQREADGRPCLTFNYTASLLRQVTGDVRLNKMQMKARPANDASMEDADVDNALFKHIQYISNADLAFDWAVEQAASCGFPGYFRVLHDYSETNPFEQDIFIKRIKDAFSVYGDPHYRESDATDRNFYFITEKVLKEDFEKQYPDKTTADTFEGANDSEMWFIDGFVVKAEYWYRDQVEKELGITEDGQIFETADNPDKLKAVKTRKVKSFDVYQCIVTGSEVLEQPVKYPCTVIPIFPVFGEEIITDKGVIHKSVIRDAIGAQQTYNFHKTNIAETLALQPKNPWVGTAKQFENNPEWEDCHLKTYGSLRYNHDNNAPAPFKSPFAAVPTGEVQAAQAALLDMEELTSVHKASRGMASNETSGKAINARKEGDDVANFYIVDNLKRAIEACARVCKEMFPTVYDTPRMLAITGEDGAVKSTLPINQHVIKDTPKGGNTVYKPVEEGTPDSIFLDAKKKGNTAVYVDAGPAFSTQRAEAADKMSTLMTGFGADGIVIAPEVIKAQDFPNADEISGVMKDYLVKKGIREADPDENGSIPQQSSPGQDAAMQAERQQAQFDMQLKTEELDLKREELRIKDKEADVKLQDSVFKHEEAMGALQGNEEAIRQMIEQTVAGMLQPQGMQPEPSSAPQPEPQPEPQMGGMNPDEMGGFQ